MYSILNSPGTACRSTPECTGSVSVSVSWALEGSCGTHLIDETHGGGSLPLEPWAVHVDPEEMELGDHDPVARTVRAAMFPAIPLRLQWAMADASLVPACPPARLLVGFWN